MEKLPHSKGFEPPTFTCGGLSQKTLNWFIGKLHLMVFSASTMSGVNRVVMFDEMPLSNIWVYNTSEHEYFMLCLYPNSAVSLTMFLALQRLVYLEKILECLFSHRNINCCRKLDLCSKAFFQCQNNFSVALLLGHWLQYSCGILVEKNSVPLLDCIFLIKTQTP